jgi:putative ABC transport system permease protein
LAAASLGTIFAARRAAMLHPAEAMRPPPPEKGGRILIENIGFIWSRLSFRWRLVMRAIFRNPFRSSVNLFTTMLSTALVVQTFSMWDSMHYLMDYQFSKLSKQDLTVTLREPEDSPFRRITRYSPRSTPLGTPSSRRRSD